LAGCRAPVERRHTHSACGACAIGQIGNPSPSGRGRRHPPNERVAAGEGSPSDNERARVFGRRHDRSPSPFPPPSRGRGSLAALLAHYGRPPRASARGESALLPLPPPVPFARANSALGDPRLDWLRRQRVAGPTDTGRTDFFIFPREIAIRRAETRAQTLRMAPKRTSLSGKAGVPRLAGKPWISSVAHTVPAGPCRRRTDSQLASKLWHTDMSRRDMRS